MRVVFDAHVLAFVHATVCTQECVSSHENLHVFKSQSVCVNEPFCVFVWVRNEEKRAYIVSVAVRGRFRPVLGL